MQLNQNEIIPSLPNELSLQILLDLSVKDLIRFLSTNKNNQSLARLFNPAWVSMAEEQQRNYRFMLPQNFFSQLCLDRFLLSAFSLKSMGGLC
jgi:hypothetical protein